MCVKFPDKTKSLKELTVKDTIKILQVILGSFFIASGIAFWCLAIGVRDHTLVFGSVTSTSKHFIKQRSKKLKQIPQKTPEGINKKSY
ncbi:MAG: hypothetical protein M1467_04180 [Deltaproteobacteria bacterium]|jgi:hypothetical protein|nr:hypothetical protein [Deltaproteobacteria bacterium]